MIYTDRSFATKYGSLTELMHLDPGHKEAYGGVIIMDATSDWRQLPVLGLRITGKEIAAKNANIMKMVALAAGHRLIEHEVSREAVLTDCD